MNRDKTHSQPKLPTRDRVATAQLVTRETDLRHAELQRTSDFQAALLGIAGHDLRQPLQVIQSAYEWLGSRVAASEKARLERGEKAIARLTEQLDRLVGALRLYEHTSSIEVVPVPAPQAPSRAIRYYWRVSCAIWCATRSNTPSLADAF